jgi:signal transduction histidine kinase
VIVLWGAAFVLSSEKRTEWQLGQQADLNRAILDAVTAHVTLIDRSGQAMELGSASAAGTSSYESGFMEALRSARWQEVISRSIPCDPTDPDQYLAGVWEVVQGRRTVYSAEYGQQTCAGFRWFLLYARTLRSREGAVVAHIDMTDRREAQEALVAREREIQLLLDAREALARDLHDEVIQRLYAIGLNLTVWRRRQGEAGSPTASRFGEVIFDVDQVIQQVRGYLDGTPPAHIAGKDLPAHLQQLIGSMTKDTGVESELVIDPATAALVASKHVPHLLAIVREAVSNALQHSGAVRVHVELRPEGESAILTVHDDGKGFDPESIAQGRGLANLRTRAGSMGGEATVSSPRGLGTCVRIKIPVEVSCDVR